ncbi:MAG TPA: YraN family protein [Burkholderiales bacterium]|jgi:putative endonuclease|nr:YraN family protein [Burkholderiales bacterium]
MSDAGQQAEDVALAYLERQGMKLLERNYRCRLGEIDLVMREGSALVFVEVRLRTSSRFGGALESITAFKRRRLLSAAKHYMSARGALAECRFDAVLLDGDGKLCWLRDAISE